jgi:hypothetical protein
MSRKIQQIEVTGLHGSIFEKGNVDILATALVDLLTQPWPNAAQLKNDLY